MHQPVETAFTTDFLQRLADATHGRFVRARDQEEVQQFFLSLADYVRAHASATQLVSYWPLNDLVYGLFVFALCALLLVRS